jgi:hypothetical protein
MRGGMGKFKFLERGFRYFSGECFGDFGIFAPKSSIRSFAALMRELDVGEAEI